MLIQTIVLALLRNIVPLLLDKAVDYLEAPSVSEGMVKDFEAKVGVPRVVRDKRANKRKAKREV